MAENYMWNTKDLSHLHQKFTIGLIEGDQDSRKELVSMTEKVEEEPDMIDETNKMMISTTEVEVENMGAISLQKFYSLVI